MIKKKLNQQLSQAKEHLENAISIAQSSCINTSEDNNDVGLRLAAFIHFCEVAEVSVSAGVLLIFAYEKGTITIDDVKKLFHIPEGQKISMADYFRKKQIFGEQTLQNFFDIHKSPDSKLEKNYTLSVQGRITAQTLHGAFSRDAL